MDSQCTSRITMLVFFKKNFAKLVHNVQIAHSTLLNASNHLPL